MSKEVYTSGVILMKAMAAGKPVVATLWGGVPELVKEGVSGYMVPPRDAKSLAAAMRKMMALPTSDLTRMGQAGWAHIEANYSLERVVDQWEVLYLEMLAKKGLGKRKQK